MLSPTLAAGRAFFIALAVLWLGWQPCAVADSAVRETTLPNGLKVVTKEIHAAPVVSLWTYYRAGSRNERPGITGISHLIEHMMFKGTPTLKRGEIDRLTALAGGKNNAFTDTDYTAYYFALPSEAAAPQGRAELETVLRIEADRMRNCLMDPKELAHETQVVLSELDGNENSPLNRLDQAVKAAAFAVHPYHWPVIGWKCDVEAITRSDVLNYYRTYYAPNNAILILVGDFDTAKTLGLVRELFGAVLRSAEPPKVVSQEPEQDGERRVTVKGEGGAVYFEALYRVPATSHPDMYPLGVLDSLLTVGRSSRLYRALVASGLATEIVSSFSQQKDPGWDTIYATCPVNVDRQKFERALDAAIGELQDHLVSPAELAKAKRQTITQTVFAMDGVSDQGMLLGVYEIVANWPYLLTMNQHTERVTDQQVRVVARKYLTPDNRTIGWFVPTKVTKEAPAPRGKPGPITRRIGACARDGGAKLQIPNSNPQRNIKLQTSRSAQGRQPADLKFGAWSFPGVWSLEFGVSPRTSTPLSPGALSALASLAPRAKHVVLPNGMVLLLQENHANPTVALAASVDAGSVFDPPNRPGLAHLTAEMLDRGSATRSAAKFHEALDTLGAELDFGCAAGSVVVAGRSLSQDLPKLLELVRDALCQPSFPPAELSRLRAEQMTALQEEEDNPYMAAMLDLRQMLYPAGHPERHHARGTRASLKAITRSDLFTFYRRHYRPDTAILALVGDFDAANAAALLESLFGSWQATGPRPALRLPPIPEPAAAVTGKPHRIPISDKAEAIVIMGARGVDIHAPDYFAALAANHILGGGELLNSRLLTSLRERQGLTYSVNTEFRASRGERPWILAMQNNPRNVEAAIAGARAELVRLRAEPPTEDELQQARATLIGGMLLDMETSRGIADTLCDLELLGLGQDWVARAIEGIWKVTPADILAAARKYLPAPDKLITVVAGPEDRAGQAR